MSFAIPVDDQDQFDFKFTELIESSLQNGLAAGLIKVVMAAPNELYDSTISFKYLSNFDEKTLQSAVTTLVSSNTITKMGKSSQDRRLPGRIQQLNDKFTSVLGGFFSEPNFIVHAKQFKMQIDKLESGPPVPLPNCGNPGSMVVLSEALFSDTSALTVTAKIPDLKNYKINSGNLKTDCREL